MPIANIDRCLRLIRNSIHKFELDLNGWTVLTEAASGYWGLTQFIAAMAGADRVFSLTRNSSYGSVSDIARTTYEIAARLGLQDRIVVLEDRNDPRLAQADIVTNLGFVRPLDETFLARLSPTVVIPLMWETWEYRTEDLDLPACRRMAIPVLGTNENAPILNFMAYIGHLSLKLLFEANLEVLNSVVGVIGSGPFFHRTTESLSRAGASPRPIPVSEDGTFDTKQVKQIIQELDALIIVEHRHHEELIGSNRNLTPNDLVRLNPTLTLIHICGNVENDALSNSGLRCIPDQWASPGRMSLTADYLGPRPLVELHTAGLKVGAEMAGYRSLATSSKTVEEAVLARIDLAQGFVGYHASHLLHMDLGMLCEDKEGSDDKQGDLHRQQTSGN